MYKTGRRIAPADEGNARRQPDRYRRVSKPCQQTEQNTGGVHNNAPLLVLGEGDLLT